MLPNNKGTCSVLKLYFLHPSGESKKLLAKARGTGIPPGALADLDSGNKEARKIEETALPVLPF